MILTVIGMGRPARGPQSYMGEKREVRKCFNQFFDKVTGTK